MENKKVIEIIQAGIAWANWSEEQKEAMISAVGAVQKQVPYKLTQIDKETLTGICKCGRVTEVIDCEYYCKYCGQKVTK